jgi:hypothetical protein
MCSFLAWYLPRQLHAPTMQYFPLDRTGLARLRARRIDWNSSNPGLGCKSALRRNHSGTAGNSGGCSVLRVRLHERMHSVLDSGAGRYSRDT